jgi:sporulation integral membrane protein YtvI
MWDCRKDAVIPDAQISFLSMLHEKKEVRTRMLSDGAKKKTEFIIRALYYAVLVILTYVAYRFAGIILPFVISFALVALMQPSIRLIHKKFKINKKVLSITFTAVIYIGAGALLFLLLTQLVIMLKDVLITLPGYYQNTIVPIFSNTEGSMNSWLSAMPPEWQDVFDGVQNKLTDTLLNLVGMVSQVGTSMLNSLWNSFPGFVIGLLFTILLSFAIGTQYDSVIRFLSDQVPDKFSETFSGVKAVIKNTVFKYIKAQLILMAIAAAESIVGLLIIGAPNVVIMTVIIALLDLLPVFGPGVVMIPWAIIELLQGNIHFAIGIVIVYAVIAIVRNVISPKIVGSQLGLHPIMSLLSIYVGYRLLGFLGMIAFPITIQILLEMHKKGNIRLFKEQQRTEYENEL